MIPTLEHAKIFVDDLYSSSGPKPQWDKETWDKYFTTYGVLIHFIAQLPEIIAKDTKP